MELSPQRRRPRPLPSTQKARRLLILLKLGWAGGHPRAWVPLPWRNSETPLESLALLGQGGRGGAGSGIPGSWRPEQVALGRTKASAGLAGGAATRGAGRDHRERGRMRDAGCTRGDQWRRGKTGWCHGNSQWRPGAGTGGGRGASGLLAHSGAACAGVVVGEMKPSGKGGACKTRTPCPPQHSGVKGLLECPPAGSA